MPGRLILCATPIGNLGDASPRLAETLGSVDLVYAEDTRRARTLLDALGVSVPVRSYFAGNEQARSKELADRLGAGDAVALITDAGTPAVADPGVSAVAAARAAGAVVGIVPGPSAVTAALACAGFGGDRFVFEGFLPRKGAARALETLAGETRTIVCFSSPHRLLDDLAGLRQALGAEREVCIAREMTKKFEELWWGDLEGAIAEWTDREPRGEFTIVIRGADRAPAPGIDPIVLARKLIEEGMGTSKAARVAAGMTGAKKTEIYRALL